MTLDPIAANEASAAIVETDAAAVEQILFNLVDNACKYAATASDRRIQLQVSLSPRYVELSIVDHGPGIDSAMARRLFKPFSKSANQAAHSAPGVGLGLALSRRLAIQLGGRLDWVPENDGASFVLRIPRSAA